MRLQSALLLLATTLTVSRADQRELALQPRVDPTRPDPPESSYESKYPDDIRYTQLWYQGKCESYISWGGDGPESGFAHTDDKYTLEPCQQYCLEQEDSTFSGCSLNFMDDDPSVAEACPTPPYTVECLKDVVPVAYTEDDHPFLYGLCTCEGEELALAIVDIVVRGLQELGKVLCTVVNGVIDALVTIAETAVSAIPGGQFVGNAARIAKAAKTFSENALDAADFFDGYLSGDLCEGSPSEFTLPDSPEDVFDSLVKAPDTLNGESMISIGCKKKSGCKTPEKRPDLDVPVRDNDKEPPKPTQKPTEKTTAEPTTEKTTVDSTTDKPTAEPTTEKTTAESTTDKPTETTQPTTTTKPTSTTTSTKEEKATDCAVCGQGPVKRAAQEERWGLMFKRAGPQCVNEDLNDDSGDDQERCGPDDFLRARAINVKTETVKLSTSFEVNFGSYATCGTAKNEAEIDKWYLLKDSGCKTTDIVKRKDGDPALQGVDFDTEHVYEPQTVPDFYEWLADGKDVGTHKKPSKDWVEKVLANPNSPDLFKLVKPGRGPGQLGTDPAGSSLQDVISFGFARSDGTSKDVRREKAVAHKDFCLLEASVNQKKGVWFNNNLRPNRLNGNKKSLLIDEARHNIRLAAAPFRYLETSVANEDAIWNKWMRVSNWIDLVLHEFDAQYQWGTSNIPGEPERTGPNPNKLKPSLRALYANFIDERLKAIEGKAATWTAEVQKNYDNNKNWNQAADHKQYMADAWSPRTGFVSSDKLRFPRPANLPAGISEFGAWGYEKMTFDAGGNPLATYIGPPPQL